jgi:hypothetical protein
MTPKGLFMKVKATSTASLVWLFIFIQLLGCGTLVLGAELLDSNLLVAYLGLFLFFLPLFFQGLLFFLRKENPFTLTGRWFGVKTFSHGIWAQINGIILMLFGLGGIAILGYVAIVTLFRQSP